MRHTVDQSQAGCAVHRLEPGCGEERVLRGEKISPEYVLALAGAMQGIQDPAAQQFARLVMDILISRAAVDEVMP